MGRKATFWPGCAVTKRWAPAAWGPNGRSTQRVPPEAGGEDGQRQRGGRDATAPPAGAGDRGVDGGRRWGGDGQRPVHHQRPDAGSAGRDRGAVEKLGRQPGEGQAVG